LNNKRNSQTAGFSRRNKMAGGIFFAAYVVFVLSGCGTTPPALPPVHPSQALPPDMDAYFYLSVGENEELLRGLAEAGGNSTMGSRYFLEHSRGIYGAAAKTQGGRVNFLIAASGDYSVGLVEFGIGTEASWEETSVLLAEGEARYYRSGETGMEIAIPSPRLMLVGSGVAEPLAWLYAGAASPLGEDTLGALESHAAGVYLPRAAKTGLPPFIPAGSSIPLKEAALFIDPSGADGRYTASGRLVFADGKDAMGAAIMLRLVFSNLMSRQGYSPSEIRQTLKLAVEAESIVFSGLGFPGEMARTILFSLMAEEKPD
jgi:hypothetical protein